MVSPMTEQTEAPEVDVSTMVPEREIEFRGRKIWVRMPKPEQILVWRRTLAQLQGADVDGWSGEKVLAALERARKIIDSVILHSTDKDWLDDLMLDGELDLKETASIVLLTVEAFAAEANRADRRAAAKPAKKATRKKATT